MGWCPTARTRRLQKSLAIDSWGRTQQYDLIYGAYEMNKQRMVRRDHMKLIHYPAVDKYEMYDLSQDPHERHNLSESAQHADKLKELQADMKSIMQSMDDPMLRDSKSS